MNDYCMCGYLYKTPTSYEESCYFYEEDKDMGATIPWCCYKNKIDPENCNKECKYYVSKKDVFNLIKEIVGNRS